MTGSNNVTSDRANASPSFDLIIDVFPCIITRIVCQFPQGTVSPRVYVVCVEYTRVTRHYASIQAYVKRADRDQAFSLVLGRRYTNMLENAAYP